MKHPIRASSYAFLEKLALGALVMTAAFLAARLYWAEAHRGGHYVIGTNHSPPFQLVHDDGTISGPIAEIFELAAKEAGITLEWIAAEHPPDRYLADPESRIDLWPLVMRLPERRGRFYVTDPYTGSQYVLFSKSAYPNIPADIPPDVVIGHAKFNHTFDLFRMNFPAHQSQQSESATDLMRAVCEDRLGAAVVEVNAADAFLQGLPQHCGKGRIYLRPLPEWTIDLGIGARFGRESVANALRQAISKLARNGSLDPIFDRYLELDRLRQRHLFMATQTEALSRDLTYSLLACLGVLGILTLKVIAQRRQRLAAQELAASKTAFLAAMSHEIRTPLTGVLGMAELLADSELSAHQRGCLEQIQQAGRRLLAIVNDVLVLSKLEAGRMQFRMEPASPRELLNEVLDPLSVVAAAKNLEILVDLKPNVPETAKIDRLKTGQILTNLIGNAVKFTDTGGIRVSVQEVGIREVERRLRFEISDTGSGIEPTEVKNIFAAYRQAGNRTDQEGTGLGLPIARMMVLQMGGYFGVSSTVGVGSTFWFELPLSESDVRSEKHDPPARQLEGVRVAIWGTGVFVSQAIREALEQQGAICLNPTAQLDGTGWTGEESRPGERHLYENQETKRIVFVADWPQAVGRAGLESSEVYEAARQQSAGLVLIAPAGMRADAMEPGRFREIRICRRPVHLQDIIECVRSAQALSKGLADRFPEEPAERAAANASQLFALQGSLSQQTPFAQRDLHVLVAEDNLVNQRIMAAMLKKLGVHFKIASDGQEALRLLDEHLFDLVLMDCRMPRLDGLETTAIIRRSDKAYAGIPVIGVSADLEAVQRNRCSEAGMDSFIQKPYTMSSLEAALRPYLPLSGRRMERH